MAAIVQPQTWGPMTGRRYGSFAGKSAVIVIDGPWHIEAIGVFQGGAVVSGVHQGGAKKAGVFQGGAIVAKGQPSG